MKQNKMILVFIFMAMVICIATLFGSCAGGRQLADKENISYSDPKKAIQCKVGRAFSIVLDSNPTTGYQWQLAYSPDEEFLKFINSRYMPPKIELAGAGGKEIWSFKSLAVGQTTIVFEYVRPWEKDKEPIKRTTFVVNIQQSDTASCQQRIKTMNSGRSMVR